MGYAAPPRAKICAMQPARYALRGPAGAAPAAGGPREGRAGQLREEGSGTRPLGPRVIVRLPAVLALSRLPRARILEPAEPSRPSVRSSKPRGGPRSGSRVG